MIKAYKLFIFLCLFFFSTRAQIFNYDYADNHCGGYALGFGYNGSSTSHVFCQMDQYVQFHQITLAGWMRSKVKPPYSNKMGLICSQHTTSNPCALFLNTLWDVYLNKSGEFSFSGRFNKNPSCNIEKDTLLELNTHVVADSGVWYHFAVTVNYGLCMFYINGNVVASMSIPGLLQPGVADNYMFSLGCNNFSNITPGPYNSYDYFNGNLDDVAISTTPLSKSQIDTLAHFSNNSNNPPGVNYAFYRFNEGTGNVSHNNLGITNNHEALMMNSLTWVNFSGCSSIGLSFFNPQIRDFQNIVNLLSGHFTPISINNDGSFDSTNLNLINSINTPYFNPNAMVKGIATDGESRMILVAKSNSTIKFKVKHGNGSIASIYNQNNYSDSAIGYSHNGYSFAIYRAPDGYDSNTVINSYSGGRYINIGAYNFDTPSVYVIKSIKLVTPPIVLVHGMWSDPSTWNVSGGSFIEGLKNYGIPDYAINTANYNEYSHITFDPLNPESILARARILNEVNSAIAKYNQQRFVAYQADFVCHSLGGLMTRSFAQSPQNFDAIRNNNKGSVHKEITIGTPHFGSPWGPILYNINQGIFLSSLVTSPNLVSNYLTWKYLLKLIDHPIGSVHRDFSTSIDNPALSNLKATSLPNVNIKKAYSICGTYNDVVLNFNPTIYNYIQMTAFGWIWTIRLITRLSLTALFQGDNDLLVALKSQRGGLSDGVNSETFPGVHHLAETSNLNIFNKVKYLLLAADTTKFAYGFPAPTTVMQRSNSINNIDSTILLSTNVLDLSKRTDSSYIAIDESSKNIIVNSNNGNFNITFHTFNKAKISNPICLIKGLGIFNFPSQPPYSISLPSSILDKIGKVNFAVVARDSTDVMLADTGSIIRSDLSTFKGIEIDNKNYFLDSNSREVKLFPYAIYQNDTSSSYRLFLDSTSGITFTSLQNKVKVTNDGLVKGLEVGNDTISIAFNNSELKVFVNVKDTVEHFSKLTPTISFSITNKNTLDMPFFLDGIVNSGEDLIYTKISGPILIQNDIVQILDSGYASIKAFSRKNEYFDSSSKIITFRINKINPITYWFIGNGNWDIPSNWYNGIIPPSVLNSGNEIVIDPVITGSCILNVPLTILPGSKVRVEKNKKFENRSFFKYDR